MAVDTNANDGSRKKAERVALLIPAYRPSHKLPRLIEDVLSKDKGAVGPVLVVDDGSGPDFAAVFQAVRAIPCAHVISHAANLGKGAALKTGFNYALTTWPETEAVVTADADGQHSSRDIVRIAELMQSSPRSVALGIRQFGKDVPWRSRLGNRMTRLVTRLATGLRVADTQTGLRGLPREICVATLPIAANGYDFEMESLLRAQTLGLLRDVRQVPIDTIYLDGNRSSHFNPLLDSMRIYYVFLRYCASSVATTVTDNAVFLLAFSQTNHVAASQICGRAVAVLVNFGLARSVVFHARGGWKRPFLEFLLLVVVMGTVSYGMIQFLHVRFGFSFFASKLLAEGMLFLGNFAVQREFIFGKANR